MAKSSPIKQIDSARYGTVSEYIRELIREHEKRAAMEELEALFIEGIQSWRLDGDDAARLGRDSPRGRPEIRVRQTTQDRPIRGCVQKYSSTLSACELYGVKARERDLVELWVFPERPRPR